MKKQNPEAKFFHLSQHELVINFSLVWSECCSVILMKGQKRILLRDGNKSVEVIWSGLLSLLGDNNNFTML